MYMAKRSRSPTESHRRPCGAGGPSVNVFIFRRDLRIADNTALLHLAKAHPNTSIVPAFFFNPMQIEPQQNPYYGAQCVQFMLESLRDLRDVQLAAVGGHGDDREEGGPSKAARSERAERDSNPNHRPVASPLVILYGSDEECLSRLCSVYTVEHVAFNRDYTPFAKLRDAALAEWCTLHKIGVVSPSLSVAGGGGDDLLSSDYSLLPLDGVLSGAEKPYAMFTPYYNKVVAAHLHQIRAGDADCAKVLRLIHKGFTEGGINNKHSVALTDARAEALMASDPVKKVTSPHSPDVLAPLHPLRGGRSNALARLEHVLPTLTHYQTDRDNISVQRTSMLSPYLKFGCVSVREVYHAAVKAFGVKSCFVKELFWREFYAMLLHNHPSMCGGQLEPNIAKKAKRNLPFQQKFASFRWDLWPETATHWAAFKEGKTGVPLVDAAVRCLNATGWCHNRNRMVIGSFATKVLFVDWRVCEQWYATKAVDYDVASNSGGWQWCSGQGADAMPYFRTFNPFQQSKKFDESCRFIKQWVPELATAHPKLIHAWAENGNLAASSSLGYPLPIVNVREATKRVIAEYGKYKS